MNQATPFPPCPICRTTLQRAPHPVENRLGERFECPRCGQFEVNNYVLMDTNFNRVRPLVSAWIWKRNKSGERFPLVGGADYTPESTWFTDLERMGFPRSVSEKMDALLSAFAELSHGDYTKRIDLVNSPHLIAEIAADDMNQVTQLAQLLHQLGYIDFSGGTHVSMKANGWNRVDSLQKQVRVSDSAFIAMWYDACTGPYRDATARAVLTAGYKPLIIDEQHFNDFIMDQVIALIRQSKFIVADFTCRPEEEATANVSRGVRGGVYWEAGLAFGMGKPVIHTCEDNHVCRRRLHFDVAQYRTIFWTLGELNQEIRDLSTSIPAPHRYAEKLALHIIASIGKGNYTG